MIRLLIYTLIVLAGAIVGPKLVENKGYLLLAVGDYTIETSVVAAVVMLLVGFALLQLLEWLLVKGIQGIGLTWSLPKRWRQRSSRKFTLQGALALAEENWSLAQTAMSKGAGAGELPLVNYLAAARAAHHQGDAEQTEAFLKQAEALPGSDAAVNIARIRYLIQDGELAAGRQCLEALPASLRARPTVLKLAHELYQRQQDWDAISRIAPALVKHKVLPQEQLQALPVEIERGALQACPSLEAVQERWQQLPRRTRKLDSIAQAYIEALIRFQQPTEARKVLMAQLSKSAPQALLLEMLPLCSEDAGESLIHQLQRQYAAPESPAYFDCLANLSRQIRQYREAKKYQRQAIELAPTRYRYSQLAELQEQLGEHNGALESYRKLLDRELA
ncbi:heme biosynthesis HemY N-terminal domain-containing protein [Ferrimonas sp. SCSIO 43195]|uniref:heme biosynthesis HemY N-terminal domain-containing protein n=1 Tax=Ferrimonas sp. SCSIO 43195 TaxID=2822844 RepID=UPI00207598CB|nr:heme biosynthesis HemY N-terminal domain-containing protein [Ferrimonas sp. SCSIO 43195]USD37414.1 heme biosynthesis protein HemY [Ferrimonas sp. SCSIO 43195]